ncbi:peptidase associated/transthyretin-like domain-containing protein [Lacinutrix jangbogonensis]|uniref:carboxypeptidase-like regulatory domain-containing protein n=1 Tax=Lacinutrix jangbogonensis TaxID=1469557 RepID=UPI00053F04C0|nr:carboxypeptidase-like regulatory domain-containing protein [Lacinutrix jangbogonensis]
MGKGNERIINIGLTIVAFFLFQKSCFSQTTILGTVKDSTNNLYSTSVILKDSLSKSIITYTYSNNRGDFELKTNKTGKFNLVFIALGYKPKIIPIVLTLKKGTS